MKKIYTLTAAVLIAAFSFAQTTIVEWTFPNESADLIADSGISANLDKEIYTEGGTSQIQFKNGFEGKAAQATEWNDGAGSKAWVIMFNTVGYGELKLSSKQSSGGNDPGPRDFKVQYKIGINGEWTDVANSDIEVQNDWTTGVLDAIELPDECNNKPEVFLRWLMTSNTNSIGNDVEAGGKSKIDNILITGEENTGIETEALSGISLFPNPCNNSFVISHDRKFGMIEIYNSSGQVVYQGKDLTPGQKTDISSLDSGIYLVLIWDELKQKNTSRKLIIQ